MSNMLSTGWPEASVWIVLIVSVATVRVINHRKDSKND